jgi:adenylosuccinate synthase
MPITAVVGGQFGSEGKGKVAGYLASEMAMSIRTGGPNAGHTVEHDGLFHKLQSIPCAFINPSCTLALGAGSVLDEDILRDEIDRISLTPGRLMIDPQAVVIQSGHPPAELELISRIGSTGRGVGAAAAQKLLRSPGTRLTRDVAWLSDYLADVAGRANEIIDRGGEVFLEGTQGFGLSLHHGHYPYVTSKDTTVGALCSEAGLSPLLLGEVIMVIRTYPIRVAGNSGPLSREVDWETVTLESGAPRPLIEKTTVTGNVRRVARFDLEMVRRACLFNRPTQLAVMFADYLDWTNRAVTTFSDLDATARRLIDDVEEACRTPVTLIGTGPRSVDMVDLRGARR